MPHNIPSRPWQKVAADPFTWDGRFILVTTDYFRHFYEVDELTTTPSTAVIRRLYADFACHSIPSVLFRETGHRSGTSVMSP